MAVSYTSQLRAAMHSDQINETTQRRLQNIQDCRNMMNSGHQKVILECTTQPLPDPIKGVNKDDGKMDEEVAKHINKCLTELVSQLDANNNLANNVITNDDINQLSFMNLNELRGNGNDQCGYNCIKLPEFDETNYVYEFATEPSTNKKVDFIIENILCTVFY
jgi:hypothetical protein